MRVGELIEVRATTFPFNVICSCPLKFLTTGVFFAQVSPCMHLRNETAKHYIYTPVTPLLELIYLNLSIVV